MPNENYLDHLDIDAEYEDIWVISFDANKGVLDGVSFIEVVRGEKIGTTPLPKATRAGYSFAGWNTKADGKGTAFTAASEIKSDLTVYAVWAPKVNLLAAKISQFASTQKTIYVVKGATVKLPIIAYADKNEQQTISWKASKQAVASVVKGQSSGSLTLTGNANKNLTIKAGKKLGTSKITLTSASGATRIITVKVVAKKKAASSMKITKLPKKNTIAKGGTKLLKASFTSKATGVVVWKSSKPSVLKVDAAGKITALKPGTAKITCKIGAKAQKVSIKVK